MSDRQIGTLIEALNFERREKLSWKRWAVLWWVVAVIANTAMWVEVARHAK